jgi:two-component system nitrogen regulation sensor histidine kinase GlnL
MQESPRSVDMALVTFWDQTQRENMESAAQEERLLDSIGTMIRRLSHELQNPLSGIKGATQLLARKVRGQPELREYPTVILKELERLERLVGSLVSQGNGMTLTLASCNLHELLDTVIWFERNSTDRVHFERRYDPSLPDILGDRDRLHQVFLNLLHNAVEASPPGETVIVQTGMTGPWSDREPPPEPGRTFFQIDVIDRGPGVSEEHRPNLFTPFFTTKRNGTGLGLSISHQIVRAHHGHLRYRPAEGGGAMFSVVLPRGEPA